MELLTHTKSCRTKKTNFHLIIFEREYFHQVKDRQYFRKFQINIKKNRCYGLELGEIL